MKGHPGIKLRTTFQLHQTSTTNESEQEQALTMTRAEKRTHRLNSVIKLAENQEKRAAIVVARARQQLTYYENRLEELRAYYESIDVRLTRKSHRVFQPRNFRNTSFS